jgi:hypothetical protein
LSFLFNTSYSSTSSLHIERSTILEKLRSKHHHQQENHANTVRRRSIQQGNNNPRPQSYKSSSSDHSDTEINDKNILKILAECRANLDRTEALKRANPQLLRPEDYVRFETFHSDDIPIEKCHNICKEIVKAKSVRCGQKYDVNNKFKKSSSSWQWQQRMSHHQVIVNNKTKNNKVKGFFHYVIFVTIYVMLIFFVTLMITQLR